MATVMAEYIGSDPTHKVIGIMSGNVYRWRGRGYVVMMDSRDWHSLDVEERAKLKIKGE